ncbi:MAG: amidohydrolase family protein [Chloroflexota bacterium]|nr:amidohydrolase family protein [Chloroflexota bacterium]
MTTLIHAAYAIHADGSVQPDFALVIEGERIVATGSYRDLAAQYPDAEQVGGAGYLMLPGMINAHDHGRAFGTASLGVADDILECWLPSLGALPGIPPELAAAWEGVQLLKSGVTATAHSHNPATWEGMAAECPHTLRGYRAAGVRVAFHPPMVDQNQLVYADGERFLAALPPHLRAAARAAMQPPPISHDDYFALCDDLYRNYHDPESHLVYIQVSPAGGQWCSDELILRSIEWAWRNETRVQMHMLETRYQREYAHKTWGKSFIRHLDEMGALAASLTLAHMVWVDEDDLPLLALRSVGIAHNPSSNLRLRSGIAPVAKMRNAGIRVGVGLDGHALDDDQDYLRELRLAFTLMGLPHPKPLSHRERESRAYRPSLAAGSESMWSMGTRDAASITFGDAPLGQLAVGMLADVVLLDWNSLRGTWSPDGYPAAEEVALFTLHRASRVHVRHVMVGGQWRLRDGRAAGVDEEVLTEEIRQALTRVDWDALRALRREVALLLPHIRQFYAGWI